MNAAESARTSLVQSIAIDDLFGQFRYRLRSPASSSGENDLLLLYGDNGAGKSTILNIVFHLLHPEPFGGHRTAIGQVPFRELEITLTSGYSVAARKDDPFDPTKYTITLTPPGSGKPLECIWERERRSHRDISEDRQYSQYCNVLAELGIAFHFLSDTRRVAGQPHPSSSPRWRSVVYRSPAETAWPRFEEDPEALVDRAIDQAIEDLRRLALTGSSEGYTSVNAIYDGLIGRILGGPSDDAEPQSSIDALREKLEALHERNSAYSKYGLTPDLDTDRLLERLNSARQRNVELLNIVLKPYLDGHNARLDALQAVQEVIDELVTILSDFLSHKSVSLDVRAGLQISGPNENRIPPALLSSGERQLLVLLCNAITARRDGTILIIDEPEISLNVKWQRRLISALLTCLRGVDTQLIMATHSIEILAQHRSSVAQLTHFADVAPDD